MKNNVIKFTVSTFTSLENIMKQVHQATKGKIIDDIFIERVSMFKKEIEILVSKPRTIYIDREVVKETKPKKASKYRGVTKFRGNYRARIHHNNKTIFIGMYTSEVEAARAYNIKALELLGKDAKINVIDEEVTF